MSFEFEFYSATRALEREVSSFKVQSIEYTKYY